jgi:hypothetical protein
MKFKGLNKTLCEGRENVSFQKNFLEQAKTLSLQQIVKLDFLKTIIFKNKYQVSLSKYNYFFP